MEFVAYVDKSLNVNDYKNPFTDEKYRESLRDLINDGGGAIIVMDGEYSLNDLTKIFDYEFKDNVFMCTASVDGFGCYGVCAREPRVHVNGFGETVRRKSDHCESIVLHKGDRVFMKTDIEIYRIPKNVYVEVKTILHYFVYNGISVESSSITNGVVCVGLVNMGSKPVTIHKDQTIAVLAVRGEHEFLKVEHKEFPHEKVYGWDNFKSKDEDHRRQPLKDECCVGGMMERCEDSITGNMKECYEDDDF